MMHAKSEVTVILDPNFGDRLRTLPSGSAVWLVRTPENERAWKECAFGSNSALFSAKDPQARPQSLIDALPDIIDHFGTDSFPDAPFDRLNVVGVGLSSELEQALETFGFTDPEEQNGGFLAYFPTK